MGSFFTYCLCQLLKNEFILWTYTRIQDGATSRLTLDFQEQEGLAYDNSVVPSFASVSGTKDFALYLCVSTFRVVSIKTVPVQYVPVMSNDFCDILCMDVNLTSHLSEYIRKILSFNSAAQPRLLYMDRSLQAFCD